MDTVTRQDDSEPSLNDCDHDHPHAAPLRPLSATGEHLAVAAAMCAALSDPSRLRLMLRLVDGERCVTELVRVEDGKASSVSARLQTLHAARLLRRRREGKHVFYALADHHVQRLLDEILSHAAEAPV